MKKYSLSISLIFLSFMSLAQVSGRFTIKGVLIDTAGLKLPDANVMLMHPRDSSLITFGRSSAQGAFEFKNVKRQDVLLKVFAVGYLPHQQLIQPGEAGEVDVKEIHMKELQKELMEVVIKAARAPLDIRGDTVEYNASSFKVPPGSTVEDLLRKLPGVQVEQDGTVRAQGETVQRVTVDGKRFFGDDPKMATKNLPAEAISKVQIFNDKTEKEKITGVSEGGRQKTMNLELKDSHKKGGFGKVTAGVGTDSRLQAKAMYNRFNEKNQFSILGFGNNTNQSGMSWDDYQDFKGSQSFNWGDDGNFGFNQGSGMYFVSGGGDDNLTIGPGSSGDRGFTKNWAGGANYNYDTKKTKVNSSYFYNQTGQTLDRTSLQQNILNNSSYLTDGASSTLNFTANHRGSLRFEKQLDSLNKLVVLSNFRFGNGNTNLESVTEYFRGGATTNRSKVNNFSRFNTFAIGNTAIYRHTFRKKGRNFAWSAAYNVNNTDGFNDQRSVNDFFNVPSVGDSTYLLHQNNNTMSLRNEVKSSLLYVEPIGKKFFWESFYNFSLTNNEVDRDVNDVSDAGLVRNNNLSRYYTNNFLYNRLGSTVRYSHKGLNVGLGLAAQQLNLEGEFLRDRNGTLISKIDQKYFNILPNISVNYATKSNLYISSNYGRSITPPSITQLQPIVDNSNPLNIFEGNPDLKPQTSESGSVYFNKFSPATFMSIYASVNYSKNYDQIVNSLTVDDRLVSHIKPINVSGGSNISSYMGFGFPIVKTKLTFNMNGGFNSGENPNFVNNIENLTKTRSVNFGGRFDFTPSDKFTLYPSANFSFGDTRYSINTNQNQNTFTANYGVEMNYKFPKEYYFNARWNHRAYENDRLGFNQNVSILNLSAYKIFLKNKRGEIRLSAYDVFNQNRGISVWASGTTSSQEQIQTLGRYFMLNFTYNLRGMTTNIRRGGMF